MKTYRVWYDLNKLDKTYKDVEAENIFHLATLLDSIYLYKEQIESIFKIELL